MITSLMDGIATAFASQNESAIYLTQSMDSITWGTAPTRKGSAKIRYPYISYNHIVSGEENYVMDDNAGKNIVDNPPPTPYYQVIEVAFEIVTGALNGQPSRSPRPASIFAKHLKNIMRRGNFDLKNGRIIDALIIDDWGEENSDTDGYKWHVGVQFELGT